MKDQGAGDFYKSLFDNMLDGLVYCRMVFDAQQRPVDYVYKFVNKNFEALTGLRDVIGKTVSEVIPGVHTSNPEFFEIYGRVALTGKPARFEAYVQPLGRWFAIAAYSPKRGYFVATFQNITEQKQTEVKLENAKIAARNVLEDLSEEKSKVDVARAKEEAILLSIGEGLIATNEKGVITLINPTAQILLGICKEDATGKPYSDIIPIMDKTGKLVPQEKRPMNLALAQGISTIATTTTVSAHYYMRKDGKRFPAAIVVTPVILDGKLIGCIEVFRDITREKEIDRAKSEFVSLASHQLRTPPTAMNWYLEMLLNKEVGTLTVKQKEYLQEVYHNNQRMIALINALLNVSRMEMGTLNVEPEQINLAKSVAEIVKELQPQIRKKHLHVTCNIRNDLSLLFDQKLLQIIIENLVANAVKYTPPGGSVTITVDIKHRSERFDKQIMREDTVVLTVSDTGYGIPETQQDKIFTKLFRADNVKTKDTDGTGLGLYLVKLIVAYCHGGAWFHSQENKGSTFCITLPLAGMPKKQGTTRLVAPHETF